MALQIGCILTEHPKNRSKIDFLKLLEMVWKWFKTVFLVIKPLKTNSRPLETSIGSSSQFSKNGQKWFKIGPNVA